MLPSEITPSIYAYLHIFAGTSKLLYSSISNLKSFRKWHISRLVHHAGDVRGRRTCARMYRAHVAPHDRRPFARQTRQRGMLMERTQCLEELGSEPAPHGVQTRSRGPRCCAPGCTLQRFSRVSRSELARSVVQPMLISETTLVLKRWSILLCQGAFRNIYSPRHKVGAI